jgi:hypothetical protein
MKNRILKSQWYTVFLPVVITLLLLCGQGMAANILNVWNPPAGTPANTTFTVQVRKTGDVTWTDLFEYNVKVGHQDGSLFNSSMVDFDFSGSVDIKVTYNTGTISSFDIRPWSYGVKAVQAGNTLTFTVNQDNNSPRKLVVRINNSWDTEVLHILTNTPETGAPLPGNTNVYTINPGDPIPYNLPAGKNTYYFNPGVHTLPGGLWVEVDMGATYTIDHLMLSQGTYNTNVGQVKYIVETKVNAGDSYATAYDGTGNTGTGTITQAFTATNARYVRLRLLGNNAASSWVFASVINEFSVFAAGGTTNLALNRAIAGGMPGYTRAVDGDTTSAYMSPSGYGNWHAGESFFLNKSGTTVYIAPGAVVKGAFMSDSCNNMTVKGRGILDCSQLRHVPTTPQSEGRTGAVWMISGSDNRVEGITILDPPMWSVVMNYSVRPVVKQIHLIGSVVNTDGIHFSGCSNGSVDGVFIRTCDDNLVMYHYAPGTGCTFKNSVFWGDDAHIALIGLGGNGSQPINDLTFQNLDILNQQGVYDLDKFNGCLKLWPNGGNQISDVVFDNIRIDSFRTAANAAVFQFRTDERFSGEGAGVLKNITVSNLVYKGAGERQSLLRGVDVAHNVDVVNFINYQRMGANVTSVANGNINLQPYVTNVNIVHDSVPPSLNLAFHKPAVSDQAMYSGHGADKAVDGTDTAYAQASSRLTPWKLTIDLGTGTTFNRVVFKSGASEYASAYLIQGSNDSISWMTLVNEPASGGGIKTYNSFGSVTYRFIRLNPSACVLSPGDWGYTVLEFEVYNDAPVVSSNLALYKAAVSDQPMYTGYDATKTTDGSITTYAQASARLIPWKLTIDLGSVKTFNRFVLKSGTTNYASAYTIQCADDNFNWNTLVSETAGSGSTKAYSGFGNVSGRYIRLNPTSAVLDATGNWGYAVLEFEVYNDNTGNNWVRRNDNAAAARYYGCNAATVSGYYQSDCHYASSAGSYAEYTFSGTGVRWIGKRGVDHGKADIYMDGVFDTTVDTYNAVARLQDTCYQKSGLPDTVHVMTIIVRSDKNAASSGYFSDWDAFEFLPGAGVAPMLAQQSVMMAKGTEKNMVVKIYPKPASSQLNIEMPATREFWYYELLTTLGKAQKTGSIRAGNAVISLDGIPDGMYLLHLFSSSSKHATAKWIVKVQH